MTQFNSRIFLFVLMVTIFNTLSYSQGLKIPIDKGSIVDNFSITFLDKNITLKSKQDFTLSKLGIKPSNSVLCEKKGTIATGILLAAATTATTIASYGSGGGITTGISNTDAVDLPSFTRVATTGYGKKHFFIYRIKVQRDSSDVPYYGMIAFFNTDKKSIKNLECGYYRVSMPKESFEKANKEGVSIYSYEYYAHIGRNSSTKEIKQPTWIMFLSIAKDAYSDLGIKFAK